MERNLKEAIDLIRIVKAKADREPELVPKQVQGFLVEAGDSLAMAESFLSEAHQEQRASLN